MIFVEKIQFHCVYTQQQQQKQQQKKTKIQKQQKPKFVVNQTHFVWHSRQPTVHRRRDERRLVNRFRICQDHDLRPKLSMVFCFFFWFSLRFCIDNSFVNQIDTI
jgi:hypothetical protein